MGPTHTVTASGKAKVATWLEVTGVSQMEVGAHSPESSEKPESPGLRQGPWGTADECHPRRVEDLGSFAISSV